MFNSLIMLAMVLLILSTLIIWQVFFRQSKALSTRTERMKLLQEKYREVSQELADEEIDTASYQELVDELTLDMAELVSETQQAAQVKKHQKLAVGMIFTIFIVASGSLYSYSGHFQQVEDWEQAVARLPELGKRAVLGTGEPLKAEELKQLALALRSKLAYQEEDPTAWMLLGRVLMSLQDIHGAELAFERSLKLSPEKVGSLTGLAQSLLIQDSERNQKRASQILAYVLRLDTTNPEALMMIALIATQRKDTEEAKAALTLLAQSLSPDDERHQWVTEQLSNLDSSAVKNDYQLQVQLSLNKALESQSAKMKYLIVFAKAPDGGNMPIAVKKLTSFSFPMTVRLSNSDRMLDGRDFSSFDAFEVYARLSQDDDVRLSKGEIEGKSILIDKTQKNVDIAIDQVYQER
ncbi:c-type cytochrome biogenesis protein CcmI [Algicola sagamiensis]|uniref:c-type cytochrome biogenesis protein CcmI n=1 Tax=Algicola sagamiensis TaxID=163869 RepID=UPI00036F1CDD|nr:c-type cytochrome biogenesis protein CcmI [Algicola sagamiensis]